MPDHPAGAGFNAGLTTVVNPSGVAGGTLRLVTSADVDSLDPARTYYVWCWLLQRTMQRTVMAYAPKPGVAGRQVVPDLAAGPGETHDGGLTWCYRLRSDVTFSDGRPVTAHDVKYAVSRLFAQDILPGGPTYLVNLLDDPDAPYPGPYREPDQAALAAVTTPDEHTVVFHLRQPFGDFDYLMAQPTTAPVPQALDTGADYGRAPATTGPYIIDTYEPGRRLRLSRNPHWHGATDPVRRALPDQLDVTIGLAVDEVDAAVIAGEFHLNLEGRGTQAAGQARVANNPRLLANADNPNTNFVHYVAIQPQVPPLDNVHCRRAVHYAADKIALQQARGGARFGGDIATSILPPLVPAHEQYDRYPAGADGTGDLTRARTELAAAGLPGGFRTAIATQHGKFRKVAETLARSLARVGIEASIDELDTATYYRVGLGLPATVRQRGFGLAITDWGPDFPTEYGFAAPLVDGRHIKRGGSNHNFAELDDPHINRLIDQAQATQDPATRQRLWREVNRAVMEHAVILPITHDRTLHLRNPAATNVYVHAAYGLYDIQAVGVRKQEP